MKKILYLAGASLLAIPGLFLNSCHKDDKIQGNLQEGGVAKVNLINAVSDGNVKANISEKKINWSNIPDDKILGGFNLNSLFIVPTDRSTIFQVVPINDTTKLWYDNMAQLSSGKMYTLYLSGTATNVKTLFKEETSFPNYIIRDAGKPTPSADSIVNIRFVNLSSSGPAIDVNIQGKSTKEASNITYESFTNFKAYSATFDKYSVVFEIRRSSDQQLINTYELYLDSFRFKSVAIVVMGNYRIEAIPYQ